MGLRRWGWKIWWFLSPILGKEEEKKEMEGKNTLIINFPENIKLRGPYVIINMLPLLLWNKKIPIFGNFAVEKWRFHFIVSNHMSVSPCFSVCNYPGAWKQGHWEPLCWPKILRCTVNQVTSDPIPMSQWVWGLKEVSVFTLVSIFSYIEMGFGLVSIQALYSSKIQHPKPDRIISYDKAFHFPNCLSCNFLIKSLFCF